MYNNAFKKYHEIEKATTSGRDTEARVLTQAAIKLRTCQRNWHNRNHTELDEALKYNQKIWTIFQTELAKKDNPLPNEIKLNILKLAAFIDKRILETMSFPSPEKLDIIIKINQNLAEGLRGNTSE